MGWGDGGRRGGAAGQLPPLLGGRGGGQEAGRVGELAQCPPDGLLLLQGGGTAATPVCLVLDNKTE